MADGGDLGAVRRLLAAEHGLCVVSLVRPVGTVSSSVVNAGVLPHPVDGTTVLGFVVSGAAYKRARLQREPRLTVTVRVGATPGFDDPDPANNAASLTAP